MRYKMHRPNRPYGVAISTTILAILLLLSLLSGRASGADRTSCADLITDGGFESGGVGWTQYSALGFNLVSDFNPHAGNLGAYLAGADNADDRLDQAIRLPSNTISLTLSLWWAMTTTEEGAATDTLAIELLRPNGASLATLATLDSSATQNQWNELVFDLSAYAGQSVILRLAARTDDQYPTDFFVDDVSMAACTAAGTPTPTSTVTPAVATPTSSPTATPTASPTATPRTAVHGEYLPLMMR